MQKTIRMWGRSVLAAAFLIYPLSVQASYTPVTVEESDGSPSVKEIATIKVSNGTLTDNGDGSVTLVNSGGSGTVNTGATGYFAYYPSNGTTVDDQTLIYTDGTNVGIGTSSPEFTLDVNGVGMFRGLIDEDSTEAGVQIGYGPLNDSPRVWFGNGSSANWQIDNYSDVFRWFTPSGPAMTMAINNDDTLDSINFSNMGSRTHIAGQASIGSSTFASVAAPALGLSVEGNVGIGTTGPVAMLDVEGGIAKVGSNLPLYAMSNNPILGLNIYWSSGWKFGKGSASRYGAILDLDATSGDVNIRTSDSGNADATATLTSRFSLKNNGSLSLGPSAHVLTPPELFSLEGRVALLETTAPTQTANYGKLYVKSSDSKLYFMNDGGTEFDLLAAGTTPTLQTAYGGDADGSDAIIALTADDDSLIFRNPAASGTDSGYLALFEQLNTGAVDGVTITQAGTGNAFRVNDVVSDTTPFIVDQSGNVGIGTFAATRQKLDVLGLGILVGKDTGGAQARTNSTAKMAAIGMPHYTNAEESVVLMAGGSNGSNWQPLFIGGGFYDSGSSMGNAVTSIDFYTAPNDTTVTPTSRMTIDSAGNVGIGTTTVSSILHTRAATFPIFETTGASGTLDIVTSGGTKGQLAPYAGGLGIIGYPDLIFDANNSSITSQRVFMVGGGNVALGTTVPGAKLDVRLDDAATNAVSNLLQLNHSSSGTPANGFGSGILFTGETTTTDVQNMAKIQSAWTDATHASRTSDLQFQTVNNAGSLSTAMTISGSGNVGIGTTNPSTLVHIQNDSVNPELLRLAGDYNGASELQQTFYRTAGAAAVTANDLIGTIYFASKDSGGSFQNYAWMRAYPSNTTASSEGGWLRFQIMNGGASKEALRLHPSSATFNGDQADTDFRVASVSSANSFYVDGNSGNVGIGTTDTAGVYMNMIPPSNVEAAIGLRSTGGSGAAVYFGQTGAFGGAIRYHDQIAGGLEIITGGTSGSTNTRIGIQSDGNVAIGTTAALNKFHVQGTGAGAAGIYLNSAVPGTTTNTLYNSSGTLYFNGSAVGGGAGGRLDQITAANTTATINNVANAIEWQWNSLAAGTGMKFSTSADFSGTLLDITNSNNSATNDGVTMKITNSGATNQDVPLMITNASDAVSFRVNDDGTDTDSSPFIIAKDGNVGIGTTDTSIPLNIVTSAGGVDSIRVQSTSASGYGTFDVHDDGGNDRLSFGYANGSSGAYAGTAFVSTASVDLVYHIGNGGVTTTIFKADGNVGIGATAPTSLLELEQVADSTNTSTPVVLDVDSVGSAGELTASSGTQTFARFAPVVNQSSSAGYTALLVNATQTATGSGSKRLLDLQTGGSSKVAVQSDGNVGIGTTNPLSKLHVNTSGISMNAGDVTSDYSAVFSNTGSTTASKDAGIAILGGGTSNLGHSYILMGSGGNVDGDNDFNLIESSYSTGTGTDDDPGTYLNFQVADSVKLAIRGNGNVGIGSTAPRAKLDLGAGQILIPTGTSDSGTIAGAMYYNTSTTKFRCYQGGWTDCIGAGGSPTLDSVGAAAGAATRNHAANAIEWQWNSLAAGTGMKFSTSADFSGTLLDITNSNNSATNDGVTMKITNSGATNQDVPLMITNASDAVSFRVNDDGTDTDSSPFIIAKDGNVGIGSVSPGNTLDVNGTMRVSSDLTFYNGNGQIKDGDNTLVLGLYGGEISAYQPLSLLNASANDDIWIENTGSSGNSQLSITGGNVGIGTTGSTSLLEIEQSADSTNTTTPVALDVDSVGAAGELTASSGTQVFSRIAPTVNQTSTGAYTALQVNATETATGSGTKRLLDLQTGGSSKFSVQSDGSMTVTGTPTFSAGIPATEIPNGITTINTADQSQAVVSGTSYYITDSALSLPASLKAGMSTSTFFVWDVYMTKTAAGTGTFQIKIYRGTNGSTSDTADVTQTLGTQTAVVDSMHLRVTLKVSTTGATGGYHWTMTPVHEAATATGFGIATGTGGQFSGNVSSVAMNTSALKFGLGFVATTGTPTIRVVSVVGQAHNID